jgi:membrane-bound lytic murein transglycosylase F
MYQESHFDPEAESHAGAFGLMQLTNNTAESLGVKNILQPEENIRAGVKHLKNLYDFYNNANGSDRLFIALAAYNIGLGHILDARNLARKMNIDPNKWPSISKTLPLLRFRKHYKDSLYGYCRGTEPIEYIKQIMIYYDILKQQGVEYTIGALSQ